MKRDSNSKDSKGRANMLKGMKMPAKKDAENEVDEDFGTLGGPADEGLGSGTEGIEAEAKGAEGSPEEEAGETQAEENKEDSNAGDMSHLSDEDLISEMHKRGLIAGHEEDVHEAPPAERGGGGSLASY